MKRCSPAGRKGPRRAAAAGILALWVAVCCQGPPMHVSRETPEAPPTPLSAASPGAGGEAAPEGVRGLPNLALPTLGGTQWWSDVLWRSGWRVQRHAATGHHRLLDPGETRRAWGSFEACRDELLRASPPNTSPHLVILLHGLGRSRRSLAGLERSLVGLGWSTANLSYASTRAALEDHAASLASVLAGLEGVERVSFVTHSLGGIVLLRTLANGGPWSEGLELERVVLLGPPSQGSELARRAAPWPPLVWILGPVLEELAAIEREPDVPAPFELGIVLGARGDGAGWNPLLEGDDDGVVSVREARHRWARETLFVPAPHTFLMDHPRTRAAVATFLATGSFAPRSD